ncbi:2-Hydroxyacid oxidase 1-like [Amphiura filiformis]|uniref:2-Hydroxyacid oxidase 1-like n=1 Tax=Amphiura filiformis TaxID=82378 RepID=UPI003B215B50
MSLLTNKIQTIMAGTNQLVCVDDFEKKAEQLLPKFAFDYYAGGADDQQTLQDNKEAFTRFRLRPRLMRDVSNRDMSTTILGHHLPHPIAIGPSAFHKMAHPDGEIATVKGAAMTSTPMCVGGSGSNVTLEDLAEAVKESTTPLWIQFYIYRDRQINERLIKRAEKAGYKALFVTVDLPYQGKRRLDIRNQFNLPSNLGFANIAGELESQQLYTKGKGSGIENFINTQFDPSVTWEDIKWLRSITRLPIVLKGILTAEDAKEAVKYGVNGILVSNHGGRQLDGVLATIDALSEVVEAVRGSSVEVYLDGGVRKGTDILKALALGAKAVFVARPVIWGLACDGQEGVKKVLDILKDEFGLAMALSGCTTIEDISRDILQRQSQYTSRL